MRKKRREPFIPKKLRPTIKAAFCKSLAEIFGATQTKSSAKGDHA